LQFFTKFRGIASTEKVPRAGNRQGARRKVSPRRPVGSGITAVAGRGRAK
jgi:hypothetical protein